MRQLHRERREAAQLGDDLDREVDRLGALLPGFGHRLDVVRLIVQRLGGFLKVVDDQPQVDAVLELPQGAEGEIVSMPAQRPDQLLKPGDLAAVAVPDRRPALLLQDRKSVVSGKSVTVRVYLVVRRFIKNKK